MLLSIYSLYGQGPFYPKLYIKGCHFSENYVQKRVFGQGTRVWAISLPVLYIDVLYINVPPTHPEYVYMHSVQHELKILYHKWRR